MLRMNLFVWLAINTVLFVIEFFACGNEHPNLDAPITETILRVAIHSYCPLDTLWIFVLNMFTYAPLVFIVFDYAAKFSRASLPGAAIVVAMVVSFGIALGFTLI